MNEKIKSGKDVIDEFFAEILHVEGVDQKTVEKLVELHKDNSFTEKSIQNALEALKQAELNPKAQDDDKD